MHRNALERGDAEALVEPGPDRRGIGWAALDAQVDAVAAGFADLGLVAGQRVGLRGPNSIEFVVGYLAILRAGLVAVPLDPDLPADDLGRMIGHVKALLVLGGPDHPLTRTGLDELARHGHSPVVSPPDPEALAVLLPTAGTSGEPQLAMLSHRALLAQLVVLSRGAQFTGVADPETTMLGALPYVHVFGLGAVVGSWLAAGARLVVAEESSDQLPSIIASESIDHLPVTPALLFRLLRSPESTDALSCVRQVLSAGAALPEWLSREFTERTGLRVEQGYGLTEASPGVAATFGGPVLGPSHVGRPLPGVEVRIGDGTETGEPDLIALRGENLFSGYWPDGGGGPDADGWFVTDDLGYFRGPELFLVDRAREVVVVHGFPVYPAEVEQVIRRVAARERGRCGRHAGSADRRPGRGLRQWPGAQRCPRRRALPRPARSVQEAGRDPPARQPSPRSDR